MNYRNRIRITTNHILIHFDSFHSILIIIITDSIYIEYTSLNGLEFIVLPSLFPSYHPLCINPSPWYAIFAHSTHIHSIDPFINTNHSNSILLMNCIQSVIMPMNYSCKTTVYQSFCTTIENEGIHYKLQFFLQTLVIPVAIINCIPAATQNKTFSRKWI